jgi:hypothetical protein
METGFSDPIKIRKRKKMKSSWNFDCPPYDERSSNFVNAGSHYGVGYNQPVGRMGNPKSTSPVLPRGKSNTMETDQVATHSPRGDLLE